MQPIKLVVLSFAPLTEAGIIEDAHARDGPCAHVNVHHETLKFAGLRALRLSRRFAFLSFTISRVAKRQTAYSTLKGLGNFLALEPRKFCSDFLFEPNYIGIRCYFESIIWESTLKRARIYFDFGA